MIATASAADRGSSAHMRQVSAPLSHESPAIRRGSRPAMHGVLVTFRRPGAIAIMLDRLAAQQRPLDTLVVVDNDPAESARPSVEGLAGAGDDAVAGAPGPSITYLAAGANLGPAGGIALGMRAVLRHASDDDWVVSLDDDDPPGWPDLLARLEAVGDRVRAGDPRVGAVGMVGGRFSARRARAVRVPDGELTGAVPVDWIAGNQFPVYSVAALRAVGVFDERLFFGFEELDYGLRLGAAGYNVYVDGDLWRRERERAGRLGLDPTPARGLDQVHWRRYYSLRNMIYILRKQHEGRGALRLAARSLAKPVANLPRQPRNALRHLGLNARAIADAYRGRMGLTVEPGG